MKYRLYQYWRSTSSWRVRWAMTLKGLEFESVPVNLLTDEAESPEHRARNPMGYLPVLEFLESAPDSPDRYLAESTAIIEWLEETYPTPALLPRDALARAHVRTLCQLVNAGMQPLHNPNVTTYLSSDPKVQKPWIQHWIRNGLSAYEKTAAPRAGKFSFGDTVTMADLFLLPQCYAALRFEVDLEKEFPLAYRIHQAALAIESCRATSPDALKPPGT